MQTLAVVRLLTPPPVHTIQGWVDHCGYVQHHLEAHDLHVNLLVVLRQQDCKLVDNHPHGQGIMC
jgi:hypothetical protein